MSAASSTVVLLMTDVEGSTPAWEFDAVAMEVAMQVHDEVVERVVAQAGGRLHKERGEGDSTFSVFPEALSAVEAAGRLLLELASAGFHLRVRAAVHVGSVTTRNGELYGPTINRTARIRGLAAGGQILLSGPVAEIVAGQLEDGVSLVDLGEHALRGIAQAERVFGYAHPLLDPPAAIGAVAPPPNNLPGEVDRFVGRERERSALDQALASHRLVTIVGAGGVGKTRLALAAAREAQQPGGVWFVDVGVLTDSGQLGPGVAHACGAEPAADADVVSSIRAAVTAPTLLILDTSERHIEVVAELVSELLLAIPQLSILVTGREPLSVQGESLMRLDPLGLTAVDGPSDAAVLFLERLATLAPELVEPASASELAVVEEICSSLDGVPLAVELAAARGGDMGLPALRDAIAAGGEARRKVQGGRRGGPARHRSVDAAIAWSHTGLDPVEIVVFRRLAVFQGGWPSAEAALAVIGELPGDLPTSAVGDALASLSRRSMVVRRDGRSRLLDTVRAFAGERLAEAREDELVARRFLTWARGYACALDADPATSGGDSVAPEMPNFRHALALALRDAAAEDAQLLAYAMTNHWVRTSCVVEAADSLQAALVLPDVTSARPLALAASALVALSRGTEPDPAWLDEARELVGTSTTPAAAEVWTLEAMMADRAGDDARTRRATERALEIARASGRADLLALARHNYAASLDPVADHREVLSLMREAAAEEVRAGSAIYASRTALADALVHDGRAGAALAVLDALLQHGSPETVPAWLSRAKAELALGRLEQAVSAAQAGDRIERDSGLGRWTNELSLVRAEALIGLGQTRQALDTLLEVTPKTSGERSVLLELVGLAHLTAGQLREAREAAEELAALGPTGSADRLAARLLVAQGDPAAALALVTPGRVLAGDSGAHRVELKQLEVELMAVEALGHEQEADRLRDRLAVLGDRASEGLPAAPVPAAPEPAPLA